MALEKKKPKDPKETFLLIQGNWVTGMLSHGKVTATRSEIEGVGLNPDKLIEQGSLLPYTPPEQRAAAPAQEKKTGKIAGSEEPTPAASAPAETAAAPAPNTATQHQPDNRPKPGNK